MQVNFPVPPLSYAPQAVTQILDTIRRAFVNVVSTQEAVHRILLRSPSGTIYEITVSDSGVVQTAVNSGKTRV